MKFIKDDIIIEDNQPNNYSVWLREGFKELMSEEVEEEEVEEETEKENIRLELTNLNIEFHPNLGLKKLRILLEDSK